MDQRTVKASHRFVRCLAGGNPLAPDLMTPEERFDEIAEILAAGILRLRRRQSEKHVSHLEKKRLDLSRERSVHASPQTRRRQRA